MADNGTVLVTGAAVDSGVGRTVTGRLLDRGLPVRAIARRETAGRQPRGPLAPR